MANDRPSPNEHIDSPEVAKFFAELLIQHGFDATAAMMAWRKGITEGSARKAGARALRHPMVVEALSQLSLDSPVNESADGYRSTLWQFIHKLRKEMSSGRPSPATIELGSLALKLLQKAYIVESTESKVQQTVRFEGLGDLSNLTAPANDDDSASPTKETVQ